jgi:hypothetical protein
MKNFACLIALGLSFALGPLTGVARAGEISPPAVPESIQVPESNVAFLRGHAVGTQNYVCLPSPTIGKVAWTLFTPQATLFDDEGEPIATHFFSPNPIESGMVRAAWEHSGDTSIVWARATASSSDPSFVASGAIPWLRLAITGARAGATGGDTLSGSTFIHRVNTTGGVAPSTRCRLPKDIGNRAYVPYTADYVFYRADN